MVAGIWPYDWYKYLHPYNIKNDLSDHPFIKDYIFEVTVSFPQIDNPIGVVAQ